MELNIDILMQTAIDEMENGQYTEAAKHFDMVIIYDPSVIEAPLFRAFCNCHGIKLGELENASIGFTKAFCRYVDAVKELGDPVVMQSKMDYAFKLLNKLVSMYRYNARENAAGFISLALTITQAASTMSTTCRDKITSVGVPVSEELVTENEEMISKPVGTGTGTRATFANLGGCIVGLWALVALVSICAPIIFYFIYS